MNKPVYKLASSNLDIATRSLTIHNEVEYGLARTDQGTQLAVLAATGADALKSFDGERSEFEKQTLVLCPLNAHNATAIRAQLPWLQPCPLGLKTSAGMGDRIGLATPGHVRAVRKMDGQIAPIFAQQSIREMARTVRTPQEVMDDATWGIFSEGSWRACGRPSRIC